MPTATTKNKLIFFSPPTHSSGCSPLVGEKVQAGFPSPADDYIEEQLDLNKYCISNPPATFFVRVEGDSMIDAGINKGDLLVVDRSREVHSSDIVIAVLDGEFTLKRLITRNNRFFLCPENPKYSSIELTEDMEFEIWGKVTKVIHDL